MRQNGAAAVDRLREKATAAKKKGEIAKREQPNRVPEPKQLLKLIGELLEGVEGDIFDAEFKFVEVKRETMVKLAKLVGISADGRK